MQIVARRSRTSTCPLCREEVTRSTGITCSECHSVCHRSCVRELGACHRNAPPVLLEPPTHDYSLREATTRPRFDYEELETPRQRRRAERRAPRRPASLPNPETILYTYLGGGLIAVGTGALYLFAQGVTDEIGKFLLLSLLGLFWLYQALEGVVTGKVDSWDEDTSEQICSKRAPLRFFFTTILWAAAGACASIGALSVF